MASHELTFMESWLSQGPRRYSCVGELLAVQVLKGKMKLEDLDNPPDGIMRPSEADYARHNLTPKPHRNPVRDWIAGNGERWDAMLRAAMALELKHVNSSSTNSNEEPSTRHNRPTAEQGDSAQKRNSQDPETGDGA